MRRTSSFAPSSSPNVIIFRDDDKTLLSMETVSTQMAEDSVVTDGITKKKKGILQHPNMQSPFQILFSTSSTSIRRSRIVARAQPLGAPSCLEAVFDGSTQGTVNCSCHPLSHHPFLADIFVKFCRCREPPQTPLPHERHLSIVYPCARICCCCTTLNSKTHT